MDQMATQVLKKNVFMAKALRSGFSLLELMVALALLGVVAYVMIPSFTGKSHKKEWATFTELCTQIAQAARLKALTSGHLHRVVFDLPAKKLSLEEVISIDIQGKEEVVPALLDFSKQPFYEWAPFFECTAFFVQGINEFLEHSAGSTLDKVWFYVTPEGIAQSVEIFFSDSRSLPSTEPIRFKMVLDPLHMQFSYDETE